MRNLFLVSVVELVCAKPLDMCSDTLQHPTMPTAQICCIASFDAVGLPLHYYRAIVHKLIRLHHNGTRAIIRQHADGGWRIDLDIYQGTRNPLTIVGYLSPAKEKAKELADREILRHGHVCTAECGDWVYHKGQGTPR